MCFSARALKQTSVEGLTVFPCLGPEFISVLLERSVKKAEGSMMRRRKKVYEVVPKLTATLKRAWQRYVSSSGRPT